ncbi:MAG TPA: hypothetical protein VIA61_02065 [Methylomirabilota bacterium]|jgi:hypothetical protein
MSTRRRIAILFHETDRHRPARGYIVHLLADYWRQWGHDVRFVYGVRRAEPADVLFVHVDLSVVPKEYLAFAARYPVNINGSVDDIRKSRTSTNIVRAGDGWDGPVIVKSDLNYAGLPEKIRTRSRLEQRWPFVRRLRRALPASLRTRLEPTNLAGPEDYKIYEDVSRVPSAHARDKRLVIERFLPELEDGLYHTRIYQFLGNRWLCVRMGSRNPIVKAYNSVRVERVEPDKLVTEWREKLRMDYGKFDYVVVNGKAILLDANKTIGATPSGMNQLISREEVESNRRILAEGIDSYL